MGKPVELSPEQLRPVYSDSRLNLTKAVPGSGKTTVLVERARRVRRRGRVLALTFSNKAARDIERRLETSDPGFRVKTIHGWCLGVVREEWTQVGRVLGGAAWPSEPIVLSEHEEQVLCSQLLPHRDPRKTMKAFRELRGLGLEPEQASGLLARGLYLGNARESDVEDWAVYERGRLGKGLLTFDDMSTLAELCLSMPGVSDKACRWEHVLLDEAQDTSHAQWRALRPLVFSAESAFVVGDANQKIYGWRGATGSAMRDLESLPETVVFSLQTSYRSRGAVARFVNRLVGDRRSFIEPLQEGGKVEVRGFDTRDQEIEAVLAMAGDGSAILSRTNGYLERFERALLARGIPYSGAAFYRCEHVVALGAFLRRGSPVDTVAQAFLENERYGPAERGDLRLALEIVNESGVEAFLGLLDGAASSRRGVVLSTGHAAKGLEWDRVFVVGVHPGHVPHRLSHDRQEETNLLYVMASRARDEAHVSYVGEPSPLLTEAGAL